MAVNRLSVVGHSGRLDSGQARARQNGRTVRRIYDFFKIQLCTIAISLTLFNTVRLPREAFRFGDVPYLVVYSIWLLVVSLPSVMLQLAMGQLSQQGAVGVWRAVPIFRGVGHIKVMTSYLCCIYNMVYVALAAAYMIWIGKGTFPLKDCTRIHMTPDGYVNKMNASECFNTTFLAPFTEQPQYLGIMAILIFILWFFVPLMLLNLHKSLKASLMVFAPVPIIIAVLLCVYISDGTGLIAILETADWSPLTKPYIWYSGLVQALLSSSAMSGYMINAGGTVYRQCDVRWISTITILTNLLSGWFFVFMWESIAGQETKDNSFLSVLILIYQSSVSEHRTKEWPLLAFGLVLVSGFITLLVLLYPVFDKLHRLAGDQWRLFAAATSALGTALTVAVLSRGISVADMLDGFVIPVLAVVTTAFEVVGFVFVYGYFYLKSDIKFITGSKLSRFWIITWWLTPVLIVGATGWWLRALIRNAWSQGQSLWPVVGAFIGILIVLIIFAGIAVAKEEQYNLLAKIAAAFHPSRLWGPEEPMVRYMWMSERFTTDNFNSEQEITTDFNDYANLHNNYPTKSDMKNKEIWFKEDTYQKPKSKFDVDYMNKADAFKTHEPVYSIPVITRNKMKLDETFRSPNICVANGELGGALNCNCNRHFQLNVPDLRYNEISTSL